MSESAKIKKGITWNIAAQGVSGVLGILTNIVIAVYGNADILGVYNQMMAYYIVLGQIASWGMQHSSIYFLTRAHDGREKDETNSALLFCALLMGSLLSILWFAVSGVMGTYIYRDMKFLRCLQSLAFALALFGINKCMAGILNAYGKMEQYACLLMIRYGIIAGVVALTVYFQSFYEIGIYCYVIAEVVVLIVEIAFSKKLFSIRLPGRERIKRCMQFGGRAMLGGVVSEINTKADVMVLGIFLSNEVVGIYSFVAMIVEGFLSIINVIKINLNPSLAKLCYEEKWDKLKEYSRLFKVRARMGAIAFGGVIVCGFWVMCNLLNIELYLTSLPQLVILLLGISYAAPQILRGNVLTFLGKPQGDSAIAVFTVGMNIMLNFIFIPHYQCYGAAVATFLSYIIHVCVVEYWHNKEINLRKSKQE